MFTSGLLKLSLTAICALFADQLLSGEPAHAGTKEVRCGWIANPTPANWYLLDRDIQWTIALMGGRWAKGSDNIADLKVPGEWVVTGTGAYGHGCACMTVDSDRKTKTITRIYSFQSRALAVCRADKKLMRKGYWFPPASTFRPASK